MKRVIFAAASTVAGLTMLLQFKTRPATTGTAAPPATTNPTTESETATPPTTATPSASTGSPTTTAPSATTSGGTKAVTGNAASTRYGPVQVQITLTNGKLTAVQAID